MRPIATAVARSVVCLYVRWSHGCALQKRLNRSRRADSVGPKNHVLNGVEIFPWEAAILGLSCPLKSIGSLCRGVCSKRDHSVVNNGTTCDAAFHQHSLPICLSLSNPAVVVLLIAFVCKWWVVVRRLMHERSWNQRSCYSDCVSDLVTLYDVRYMLRWRVCMSGRPSICLSPWSWKRHTGHSTDIFPIKTRSSATTEGPRDALC